MKKRGLSLITLVPEVLAQEIVEQLEAALEEFRSAEEVLADAK